MPIKTSVSDTFSLSQSQYIRGLQCTKSLWLHKFHPELRNPVGDSRQAAFSSGTDVGRLAQDLFPGGVEIAFGDGTLEEQIARTRELMAAGVEVLYEATFRHDGILVKADILRRSATGVGALRSKKLHGIQGHLSGRSRRTVLCPDRIWPSDNPGGVDPLMLGTSGKAHWNRKNFFRFRI